MSGRSTGYSDLILENGSQYMYGVSIPSINGANAQPVLVSFDLSSFVNGGTNADGSIHQISVTMVGAGGDFPVNFNFSGNVPNPLPVNIPDACTVSIAATPDGPAITLSGSTNQTYVIQASFDMHNWTTIRTNMTDANGFSRLLTRMRRIIQAAIIAALHLRKYRSHESTKPVLK